MGLQYVCCSCCQRSPPAAGELAAAPGGGLPDAGGAPAPRECWECWVRDRQPRQARLAASWERLAEGREDKGQEHTSLSRLQQVPSSSPRGCSVAPARPAASFLRANEVSAKRDVVKSMWGRDTEAMIWKVRRLNRNMAVIHYWKCTVIKEIAIYCFLQLSSSWNWKWICRTGILYCFRNTV